MTEEDAAHMITQFSFFRRKWLILNPAHSYICAAIKYASSYEPESFRALVDGVQQPFLHLLLARVLGQIKLVEAGVRLRQRGIPTVRLVYVELLWTTHALQRLKATGGHFARARHKLHEFGLRVPGWWSDTGGDRQERGREEETSEIGRQ